MSCNNSIIVVSGTWPAHAEHQAWLWDIYKPGISLKRLQMKQNQNIPTSVCLHGMCAHTTWPSVFHLQIAFVKKLFLVTFFHTNSLARANANKANPFKPADVLRAELAITPSEPEACVLRDGSPPFRTDRKRCRPHTRGQTEDNRRTRSAPAGCAQPLLNSLVATLDSFNYSRRSLAARGQPWQIPLILRQPSEHRHLCATFELQPRTTGWLT